MKASVLFMIFLVPLVLSAQVENKSIQEGNEKFRQEDYTGAQQSYEEALTTNPASEAANYNMGNVYYKQQKYPEAINSYRQAAETTTDPTVRAQAYHNMGNAYLEQKNYGESVNAYKQALRNNPNDAETKYNLAYAQRMLQQQQNKQNKQDQKDEKKEDQKKEEQKNEEQNKDQQQPPKQPQEQKQFSKEELDRIMEALNADDKNVQDKINQQKVKAADGASEKDW